MAARFPPPHEAGWFMKILLTNDDGIHAKGLLALYEKLSGHYPVTIIAPDRERSAVGHGITLHEPLRVSSVEFGDHSTGYAVSGTPADCVKMGMVELMDHKPDLVISGINPGENTGINLNYSGTVAAAREAALYGIPSIAVSIRGSDPVNYREAAGFMEEMVEKVFVKGLPAGTVLNVNIPDMPLDRMAGVRVSRQGNSLPSEYMEKKVDPRKREYYWHRCEFRPDLEITDSDETALHLNFISITPIKCDMTDYGMLEALNDW